MQSKGALENLTILDLTRVVSGPYCGAILADMGAKMIKIEKPVTGDDSREYGPYVNGESAYYANLNRNKLGITLNLKHPEGKEVLLAMVKKADILIENFRPGVMEDLGLGYETLKKENDRLIYAAISGFGSYGKYAQRPGYDIISQAMGSLMSLTGQKGSPPTRSGNAMGDILGGMNLAIGILAAVNARTMTGKGQKADVSLVDSVVASLENAFARYFDNGKIPQRTGNSYASIAPYDSYQAMDGYVIIACGNQRMYEILCNDLLYMPELIADPRFLSIPLRVENNEALKSYIEQWTKKYTVESVVRQALHHKIPAAPIYDIGQITQDSHIAIDREMFVEVDHPIIGTMKVNGNPIKLMDTKVSIRHAAPALGQHNREIFVGMLGISEGKVDEYLLEGVI